MGKPQVLAFERIREKVGVSCKKTPQKTVVWYIVLAKRTRNGSLVSSEKMPTVLQEQPMEWTSEEKRKRDQLRTP